MESPVPLSSNQEHIPSADFKILSSLFPANSAHFWGVQPGKNEYNVKKFDKVKPGDITIFYKEKSFFFVGTVAHTFRSAEFAQNLWGTDNKGETWELVCAFDEVRRIHVPISEFNEIMGFEENYRIQGFEVRSQEKSDLFLNTQDLYSHRYLPSSNEPVEDPPKGIPWDQLDAYVRARRRREQGVLRRSLLGNNRDGICALCGESFPAELLVAAHIKKRQKADDAERRDIPNIAMLACKFGCDDLFELGYITVDENDNLIVSELDPSLKNSALSRRLNELSGRHLPFDFMQPRERYFYWHHENTFHEEIS